MFALSMFSDNSSSGGEEPKPSLGFSLNVNLLVSSRENYHLFPWVGFSIWKMGMMKLPRAIGKRLEGPETGKRDLVNLI